MNSQAVRSVLIGLISALIGVMLIAIGFIARVATEPSQAATTTSAGRAAEATLGTTDFATLNEIFAALKRDYVEPDRVDAEQLFEGAVNGVFKALGDPHSTYIDPDTYAISRDDFSGAFHGIGATVALQGEYVVIVRAMPGGDIIGFAPPLVITPEEIDAVVDCCARALSAVGDGLVAEGHCKLS